MSKTVLIVISDLEFGGAQRQVIELANHMERNEWKVYVCSLSDFVPLADSLKDRAKRLKIIRRKARFDFTVVFRLARLLCKYHVDIVQSYLFDADIASRLAGRLARKPVVIGSERNTDYTFKKSDLFVYRLTRWCNDFTIANSNAGAAFNGRMLHQPSSHYRVVHNGVDIERFKPIEETPVREEFGLAHDQPVVGMFASFKPQKNHQLLLRAAREVVKKVPNVRFLFVGDELYKGMSNSVECKESIIKLINDYGLRQHCIFAGNKTDVEKYYAACTVTVLPSLFEGTPNVALESMACGVPVVATDVSDNAYVIPDSIAGYIVPLDNEKALADRLCQVIMDKALRRKLSSEATTWVIQEFSCQRLAEKTAAVYAEAIHLKRAKAVRAK